MNFWPLKNPWNYRKKWLKYVEKQNFEKFEKFEKK